MVVPAASVVSGTLSTAICSGLMTSPLIAYLRISTGKQAKSGLGIEAQRRAIAAVASAEGFEIIGEFVEYETGKGSDALNHRPAAEGSLKSSEKAQMRGGGGKT